MIDRMMDRCKRICGGPKDNCFINSKEQVKCIADMAINKTSSISMLLSFALDEPAESADFIKDALASSNELSNWIKYLQMVPDLKELNSLVLDSNESEKRNEIRYPVPEGMSALAQVIHTDGHTSEHTLINFSQSGIQLAGSEHIESNTELTITLYPQGASSNEGVLLKAKARYTFSSPEGFRAGILIDELSGGMNFNAFNNVYNVMTGI